MQEQVVENTFGIDIIPVNDEQRLEALRRYHILDTPPEEVFDNLAQLVANNFNVPIALISLVDADRVFFKGNVGMPGVNNISRGKSLCSLAILSSQPTIIEKPLEDPCLLSNPLVHGKFGLRFYAGAPITTPDGYNIGTVCIVDKKERIFTQQDQEQLVRFAKLVIHEIETRKRAQVQVGIAIDVINSEQSFRTLAHNSPDLIIRHDKDFRYQYVSPLIEKLTGKKPDEFIGKTYWQMGLPAHLCKLFDESLAHVFATQTLHHVEYTVEAERNTHIYTRLVPEFDDNGQITSVMTISTDITEQKEAAAALAYQKKLLETVTDNTSLALFLLDADRKCVYMNESAEQMTGFSFLELKGKNLHEEIHHTRPDGTFYPIEACPLATALPQHTQIRGEEFFVRKNGSFFPVAFTASPIFVAGQPSGTVLEVKDITQEKEQEKALRESEHRFQQMANTLPIVVWTASPDGQLTYISAQWEAEFGNSIAESLGWGWAKFVHPDDVERAARTWQHALATGEDYEIEFRALHKTQAYRWLLVRAVPIRGSNGEIVSWYGSNTDIEEKKKTEVILEQRVQERTRELEQRNRELEQFTYVSHHDLQEPLRKIIMFSGMVEAEAAEKLSATAQNRLSKVTESAQRMSKALREVLDFASLDKVEQLSQVDLNEVVAAVQADLELAIQEKGARIMLAPLPFVKAVAVQMHQLFYNLLNNALKFSRPETEPQIHIHCRRLAAGDWAQQKDLDAAKDYYEITVQDNGIGFSPHAANKIFDLFHRLHSRQEYAGTGIGLALAKKVVQNHGGFIWAEGKQGVGATFRILLPAA